jgi:hypothetical protein
MTFEQRRMTMPIDAAARGSQKLLAELAKKGPSATVEDVKAAVALPFDYDYKLLRWLMRGTPPIYFEVETTLQVAPQQLGEAINHLAANPSVRDINVLIYGIPKPDIANVGVVMAHSGEV